MTFEIVLVFRLCLPERGGRRNLSYDLPWPDSRGVDIGDRFVSDLFLCFAGVEDMDDSEPVI
jgi:hypothetical protein